MKMEEIVFIVLLVGVVGRHDPNMPDLNLKPKPDKCNRPAEFMYQTCCVFPPFFNREVAKLCGAFFEVVTIDKVNNITAFRRLPATLCEHWKCVLDKYGLLTSDMMLDHDKYYRHLVRWTALNPNFTEVVEKAKDYCKNVYRVFLPLRVCEFFDLHGCIRNYVNVQCPVMFPGRQCQEVREFFNECKEYYL